MGIEISCNGCGSTLRVADEHAGKQARCPKCLQIQIIPIPEGNPDSGRPEQSPAQSNYSAPSSGLDQGNWYVKIPSGETYGPAEKSELFQWASEGRLTADCFVRNSLQGDWVPASDVVPSTSGTTSTSTSSSYTSAPVNPSNPYQSPTINTAYARPQRTAYAESHRGGMILAFGILTWFTGCPIFGILAWVMGADDLKKMARGSMDSSGRDMTYAGHLMGMIHTILIIIVISGVFCCGMMDGM